MHIVQDALTVVARVIRRHSSSAALAARVNMGGAHQMRMRLKMGHELWEPFAVRAGIVSVLRSTYVRTLSRCAAKDVAVFAVCPLMDPMDASEIRIACATEGVECFPVALL